MAEASAPAVKHRYKLCCGLCSRSFRMAGMEAPPDVHSLFHKYAVNNAIGPHQLLEFLIQEQGEASAKLQDAEDMINAQLRESSRIAALYRHGFNLDMFFNFLLNPALNPAIRKEVHHDMSEPISHYYIYTGHNSYLTGNQLSSDASEKPIIKALQRGVRVVELDLWPSDDNANIQVLHGKTLTTPVDFAVCIRAIKDNAFVSSEFPVVITLEDHLNPQLQAKVVEIITGILGDLLYIPPENESFKELLSPLALKKRILISTKPPKEYLASVKETAKPAKGSEAWGEDIPDDNEQAEEVEAPPKPVSSSNEGDDADDKTAPEYKHIIAIRQKKVPKDLKLKDVLAEEEETVKRISLSESELEKICKKHSDVVIKFTRRNVMRIYPYGLRINSSNYDPFVGWRHGAQMVAFNMQGYGRPLWVVHGFFKANGGCGYVRKPDFLLQGDGCDASSVKKTLKVKVHMGVGWLEKFGKRHFDNFSPPDFYTRIGIAGVPADRKMQRTKAIEDDWHPQWGEEFEFPLRVPELAVVRVEVHEYDMSDKDDFGGQVCLPLSEIKTGMRAVTLCDKKGDELTGVRLLLSFQFV